MLYLVAVRRGISSPIKLLTKQPRKKEFQEQAPESETGSHRNPNRKPSNKISEIPDQVHASSIIGDSP